MYLCSLLEHLRSLHPTGPRSGNAAQLQFKFRCYGRPPIFSSIPLKQLLNGIKMFLLWSTMRVIFPYKKKKLGWNDDTLHYKNTTCFSEYSDFPVIYNFVKLCDKICWF